MKPVTLRIRHKIRICNTATELVKYDVAAINRTLVPSPEMPPILEALQLLRDQNCETIEEIADKLCTSISDARQSLVEHIEQNEREIAKMHARIRILDSLVEGVTR